MMFVSIIIYGKSRSVPYINILIKGPLACKRRFVKSFKLLEKLPKVSLQSE